MEAFVNATEILVVEDDPVSALAICNSVSTLGYRIAAVTASIEETLHVLEQKRPAAVLMDINLNGTYDGIDIARTIRARFSTCLIFLTSYADSDTLKRAREVDPDGFLVKPCEPRDLEITLELGIYRRSGAPRSVRQVIVSEQWLNNIVEFTSLGIASFDADEICRFANGAARRMWGQDGVVGRSLHSLTHGSIQREEDCPLCGLYRAGQVHRQEACFVRGDGSTFAVEYSLSPIVANGGVTAGVLNFLDCTERVAANKERAVRTLQSAAVARIGQLALGGVDLQTLLQETVDQIAATLETHGATALQFDAARDELHLKAMAGEALAAQPYVVISAAEGNPSGYVMRHGCPVIANDLLTETRFRPAPGLLQGGAVSCVAVPIAGDGAPFGTLVAWSVTPRMFNTRDVNVLEAFANLVAMAVRRQEAQRRLERLAHEHQMILDSAGEGIYALDRGGRITMMNPAALRMLGWSSSEVVGANGHALLHRTEQAADCDVCATLHDGQSRRMGGDRIACRDGGSIPIDCVASPIMDDGQVGGVVCTFSDITERHRAAEALRQSEMALIQSQKMEAMGMLAGGVAHDFNNLLTAINGYSEILMLAPEISMQNLEYVDEIHHAGERAAALTRQLLTFSRKQIVMPKMVKINSLVREVEKLLRRLIGEDILLHIHLHQELPAVWADPGHVEQIIMNLAVNARDAMPRGGRLTIETAVVDGAEPAVILSVSDTGCGMDSATQGRIFEPFFTTKEAGKGTGLGLSTVYGIVKQAGGQIMVRSTIDVGTTFEIVLPAHVASDEATAEQAAQTPEEMRHATENILVVEDDGRVLALVRAILESKGYHVSTATNGAEAVEKCREVQGPLHLLLTDTVMPGLGGREVAERVTALRPEARVLFMSGYTDDAILRHGVIAGVPFMQKPFKPAQLLEKIREVLTN